MTEIFFSFLRLGITSFGGPVAHLSFFRQEFVLNRQWLSDQQYTELVTICQVLPGPASSQVGFCLGLKRGGLMGALLAFVAFTLPSVMLLLVFALFSTLWLEHALVQILIESLKLLAVFVVAQAVWGMAHNFCNTLSTALIGLVSVIVVLIVDNHVISIGLILCAMCYGAFFIKQSGKEAKSGLDLNISKPLSYACLFSFILLLIALSLGSSFGLFYQAGAFVFGGGHVVLPLLQSPLIDNNILSESTFIAGYGATQLVPGPIFSFASYLGFMLPVDQSFTHIPLLNALIATVLIFLPGFLLVIGFIPHWQSLSRFSRFRSAIVAASAAVVGILFATLLDPILTSSMLSNEVFSSGTVHSNLVNKLVLSAALLSTLILVIRYSVGIWVILGLCGLISVFFNGL